MFGLRGEAEEQQQRERGNEEVGKNLDEEGKTEEERKKDER